MRHMVEKGKAAGRASVKRCVCVWVLPVANPAIEILVQQIYLAGSQKTLVGKQGNETGKGRRSMISVLSSRLPAVGTCVELWKTA